MKHKEMIMFHEDPKTDLEVVRLTATLKIMFHQDHGENVDPQSHQKILSVPLTIWTQFESHVEYNTSSSINILDYLR